MKINIHDVKTKQRRAQFRKQDKLAPQPALIGHPDGTIDVPGMDGCVYVRVGKTSSVDVAYNSTAPKVYNLQVLVGYNDVQPELFQVLNVYEGAYNISNQPVYPAVAGHHATHEWDSWAAGTGGNDLVWVNTRQWTECRVYTVTAMTVGIQPGMALRGGVWTIIAAQTINLNADIPGAGLARYTLIYLDAAGVMQRRNGTAAGHVDIGDCPAPLYDEISLAAVLLYFGQTVVDDTPDGDIVDVRLFQPFGASMSAVCPPATARGDILRANASAAWTAYSLAGASGSVLTRDANDPLWSTYYLSGTAAQTYTFPAAGGTVALLNAANMFTAAQTVTINATTQLTLRYDVANYTEFRVSASGALGIYPTGDVTAVMSEDAGTNNITETLQIGHTTSGVPAVGFGAQAKFYLDDNGAEGQAAAAVQCAWTDPVDATRTAALYFKTVYNAGAMTLRATITNLGVLIPSGEHFYALTDGNTGGYYGGSTSDVLLYRGAANTWQTPDSLIADADIFAAHMGIGITAMGGVSYALEIEHSRAAALTTIYHKNSAASNVANQVSFQHGALTSVQMRTILQILSNFDDVVDATRNSNVLIGTAAAGAFATTITINGRDVTLAAEFGCNGAAHQPSYASGGALAGYVTGAFGLDSDAHMHAMFDLVVAIRAALVADGIMS